MKRRRPLPPDKRHRWDDPNMPTGAKVTMRDRQTGQVLGTRYATEEEVNKLAQWGMMTGPSPNWRHDASYYWRKRK